jgi:hypothetical protein
MERASRSHIREQGAIPSAGHVGVEEKEMLWDASAIHRYAVETSDGQIGTVSDLLFDDAGWVIRWLIVDTGTWLTGRKVLLPLSALGQPDRSQRHFPVKPTMQQVKDNPDVDTDQPVSHQLEDHVYNFYGLNPYWSGGYFPMSNQMATPLVAPLYGKPDDLHRDAQPNQGAPHLGSIAAVTGYHLHATDGVIGHVEDFLVDDAGWSVSKKIPDVLRHQMGRCLASDGGLQL